jgi:hypothetical protein
MCTISKTAAQKIPKLLSAAKNARSKTPRSLRAGVEWLCHSIWQRYVDTIASPTIYSAAELHPTRLPNFQSRYLYLTFPLSQNLSRSDCRKYFVFSQRNPDGLIPQAIQRASFFFYQSKQLTINSRKPQLILSSKICPA